ncbi:MAG: choice-of-anchor D domain-containing protein, partial [Pedobacter sp.]
VVFTPTGDGTNYVAAANDSYSTANQVVYSTTTGVASKTITGLTNGSEYCFKIFLRRGTEWTSGTSACATPSLIYCAAPVAGTMDYQTSVTNVTLNTLNNSSSTKTAGYVNNTALTPTNLNKGESYNLSVSVNTAGNWEIYSRAWIDWNKDGDFNDSGEEFDLGYATNTTNGITNGSPLSITVPTTALVGTTRMRVSAKFLEYATPCDSGYDGEIEDYTINIVQVPGAEIYVKGNSQNIVSGSTTTSSLNQTVFAIQPIGTTSAAKDYIVGNVGLSNLILNGTPVISLTGANSGDFAVTQNPATTIASETFSTFSITFTPSGPGTRTAVVSIANNDSTGGENPFTFTIQGTGKSPE